MKIATKSILVSCLIGASTPAMAGYELVCEGNFPQSQHQTVFVDCNSRKAVADKLKAAWSTIRNKGIRGDVEDMCWKPLQTVQELHPSMSLRGIAPTLLRQCNYGLEYAE